jgi:hypothetical protein
MRQKAREVTLSRNVIGWTEIITKLGRTVAAGGGSFGAREKVTLVLKKPSLGVACK